MMPAMKKHFLIPLLILFGSICYGQDIHWKNLSERNNDNIFRAISVNEVDLSYLLSNDDQLSIELPLPDGSSQEFILTPSRLLSPGLAKKFPGIKTFNAISKDGRSKGKIDYSASKGFHAMIFTDQGTVFIDPNNHRNYTHYNSYFREEYKSKLKAPDFLEEEVIRYQLNDTKKKIDNNNQRAASGAELRKYRLAVSADNEYSAFHGDTKEEVMAAIVTTMNRVTGIYELDVAVTFELIENNDLLIFLDPETDPFNGASASSALSINQFQTDSIIGSANYDIGHIFTTGSGGLAGLGVVCSTTRKAQGTTGTNNPVGDPFDVDYVAHEIGHQFGGNHTFNGSSGSCSGGNRNSSTAYEPGSGTTIMAYAGICSPQNIQGNSDAFFHAASIEEIVRYTTVDEGNTCPVITASGNTPPVASVPEGGFSIPVNTPFILEGNATDADGDNLTYSWEQWDLGPTGHPNEPVGNAPLFRAFLPSGSPIRQFPQSSDLLSGSQTLGEILPGYSRELNFRFVVRDNNLSAGGVDTKDISFNVSADAGPFVVTSQTTNETLLGGSQITVEWDVANTDLPPVNCDAVNIYLSNDGGQSFPILLRSNTANDGTENIQLPIDAVSEARIKVEAANNIFFNVNSSNFVIEEPTEPDFVIDVAETTITVCNPNDAIFDFTTQGVLDFSGDITWSVSGLPSALNSSLSNATSPVGSNETLTISDIANASTESVSFQLTGTSGSLSHSVDLTVNIISDFTSDVSLSSPGNGITNVSTRPNLIWEALEGADYYSLQVAGSSDFSSPLIDVTNLNDTSFMVQERLQPITEYFWRVKAFKGCDHTTDYTTSSFTTGDEKILDLYEDQLDITISSSGTPTVTSKFTFDQTFEIIDVNVVGLDITHSWISDLTVTLQDPSGYEVVLFDAICDDQDNILINLDDDAETGTLPCPPVDSLTFRPEGALSSLIGNSTRGNWILRVTDNVNQDGGSINAWGLEILYKLPEVPMAPSDLEIVAAGSFIEMRWTDNSNLEDGFVLQRSSDLENWETLDSLEANITGFTDLRPLSTTSHYRVSAFNVTGNSGYSEPVSNVVTSAIDYSNQIKIAPNPGTDFIRIMNNTGYHVSEISLLDLSGKEVIRSQSTTTIDTSQITGGIYLVRMRVQGQPVTIRWVKK